MRVIAGKYRGLRLDPPPGDHTRPITDRVKESIFSLLTHRLGDPARLPDAPVLDLFAGCGSFGIESLSRGAGSCLFVERDARTLRVLRGNLERVRAGETARTLRDNVWSMRFPRAPEERGYRLIFLDPPYRDARNATRVAGLLDRVAARLAPDGLIVWRCEDGAGLREELWPRLSRVEQRTWGRMMVTLLERRDDAQARRGEGDDAPEASR